MVVESVFRLKEEKKYYAKVKSENNKTMILNITRSEYNKRKKIMKRIIIMELFNIKEFYRLDKVSWEKNVMQGSENKEYALLPWLQE